MGNAKTDRITVDPQIMAGKPVVRGTRIPVEYVLGRMSESPDLGELFAAYPELTREDVKACLQYAQNAVEAKGAALLRDLDAGLADIEAGRIHDAEMVFAELLAEKEPQLGALRRRPKP